MTDNLALLKKSLEQIEQIVEQEAYDAQARQYIKQWVHVALQAYKGLKNAN